MQAKEEGRVALRAKHSAMACITIEFKGRVARAAMARYDCTGGNEERRYAVRVFWPAGEAMRCGCRLPALLMPAARCPEGYRERRMPFCPMNTHIFLWLELDDSMCTQARGAYSRTIFIISLQDLDMEILFVNIKRLE